MAEDTDEETIKKKLSKHQQEQIKKGLVGIVNKLDMAQHFVKYIQPLYFDKNQVWWLWNKDKFKWVLTDETEILNLIDAALDSSAFGTEKSSTKNEILEALRRKARLNKPEEIPLTWIQFKDTIVDIKTGEQFKASSEWFVTNPIPWAIGESDETPTMDKIFKEWVGPKFVDALYEVIAYCLLPDYPMQRLFCLNGSGCNGKGSYQNLLIRFLGAENVGATDLDTLMTSRFEAAAQLYKKLLCTIGETNFATMKRTSFLKRATGRDPLPFQFKFKQSFKDYNYAKIVIATNQLPTTYDKTMGFYRRWFIIDFPYVFSEQKDVIAEIPEKEYNNLAKKSIQVLKRLLEERAFSGEGTMEDRKQRYEDLSNPMMTFIRENYSRDNPNSFVYFNDFQDELVTWLQDTGRRIMNATEIGNQLKLEGFEKKKREGQTIIYGLKKKIPSLLSLPSSSTLHTYIGVNETTQETQETGSIHISEEEVKGEKIHHKCVGCGLTPCVGYDDKGNPLCYGCYQDYLDKK